MRRIEYTGAFRRDFKREKAGRHLKPDLVLIYRKPDKVTLQLVRLGSHNGLFG